MKTSKNCIFKFYSLTLVIFLCTFTLCKDSAIAATSFTKTATPNEWIIAGGNKQFYLTNNDVSPDSTVTSVTAYAKIYAHSEAALANAHARFDDDSNAGGAEIIFEAGTFSGTGYQEYTKTFQTEFGYSNPQTWYFFFWNNADAAYKVSEISVTVTYETPNTIPIEAPLLTYPDADATGISLTPWLAWENIYNANDYRGQISDSSGFNTIIAEGFIQKPSYRIPSGKLALNSRYYWRVRGENEPVGQIGQWSEVRKFQTSPGDSVSLPAPDLTMPPDWTSDTSLTPVFDWENISGADYYRLQVSDSPDFYDTTIEKYTRKSGYVMPNGVLSGNTGYYWRVRGEYSPANKIGAWSEIWTFNTWDETAPIHVRSCIGYEYEQNAPQIGVILPTVALRNVSSVNEGETIYITATEIVDLAKGADPFFRWCADVGGFEFNPDINTDVFRTVKFVAPVVTKDEMATVRVLVGDNLGYVAADSATFTIKNIDLSNDPVVEQNAPPSRPSVTGPTTGETGLGYTFTASASDPDGNSIQYRFRFENDVTGWQSSDQASHAWQYGNPGHNVMAQARDSKGAESDWSAMHIIDIMQTNRAPNPPQIAGNTSTPPGVAIELRARSIDPDGDHADDRISYLFDWGDGTQSDWIQAVDSKGIAVHAWNAADIYCVKAKAMDADGFESPWSECMTIRVAVPNQAVERPTVSGPEFGVINTPYTFTAQAIDPDGDPVQYFFKTRIMERYYLESGWQAEDAYTFTFGEPGTYCIKASARDVIEKVSVASRCHDITVFSEEPVCKVKIDMPDPDNHDGTWCQSQYFSDNMIQIVWSDADAIEETTIDRVDIYYAIDNGPWNLIATDQYSNGYAWYPPTDFVHDNVYVKVIAYHNTGCISEAISKPFDILDGRQPDVTILAPAGGETYYMNEPVEIRWQANCPEGYEVESVHIGTSDLDVQLQGEAAKQGSYTWYPPPTTTPADQEKVALYVYCTNCQYKMVQSTGYFSLKHRYDPSATNWTEAERPFVKMEEPQTIPDGWTDMRYSQSFQTPDVAVDNNGNLHVIASWESDYRLTKESFLSTEYYREFETQLFYRKKVDGVWQQQEKITYLPVVEAYSNTIDYSKILQTSLALDSNGTPHVIYVYKPNYEVPYSELFYVTKSVFGWTVPVKIATNPTAYSINPVITIDNLDNVYVFWSDRETKQLSYKIGNGSSWSETYTGHESWSVIDVAVDADNVIHCVAYQKTNSYYATFQNGIWSSPEPIFNTFDIIDLELIDGIPYVTPSGDTFRMFYRKEGIWQQETYEWPELRSSKFNLWQDRNGSMHLIYSGYTEIGATMLERVYQNGSWSAYNTISNQKLDDIKKFWSFGNDNLISAIWQCYIDGYDVVLSYSDYSALNWPPSVSSFTADKSAGEAPLDVTFSASAEASSGSIVEYMYIFGDGTTQNQNDSTPVSHTYAQSGTYMASVVAKDDQGMTASSSVTITVDPAPNYDLHIALSPENGGVVYGDGFECNYNCVQSLPRGSTVDVIASSVGSHLFSNWDGCDSVDGNRCTIRITGEKHIAAAFGCDMPNPPSGIRTSGSVVRTGQAYTIGWDSVESAWKYTIEESDSADFSTILSSRELEYEFAEFAHDVESETVYYYRVKANNGCNSVPLWSQTVKTTVRPSTQTLTVGIYPAEAGAVTDGTEFQGIHCPDGSCISDYRSGDTLTLSSAPGEDYVLKSWTGCDSVNVGKCTVDMAADKIIFANFACKSVGTPFIASQDPIQDTGGSSTVTWNSVEGADAYMIEISSDQEFLNLEATEKITEDETRFAYTEDTVGKYYVRLKATKDCGSVSNWSNVLEIFFVGPGDPILNVSPVIQTVSKDAGASTFEISNAGSGTMIWSCSIEEGSSWLTIEGEAAGTDSGVITINHDANSGNPRVGKIIITSDGVIGSPFALDIRQYGQCMAGDINDNQGIDLADLVKGLQVLSGAILPETITNCSDVNFDGRIGMEEVMYIFKKLISDKK